MPTMLNHASTLAAPRALGAETVDSTDAPANVGGKLAFVVLWLFTFAVFGRPEDIVGSLNILHLPMVLGITSAVLLVGALLTGTVRFRMPRELVIVLLLTGWFILGVPFAYWRGGSVQVLTDLWFKTVLSFILLTQLLTSIARIRQILWAILLSELLATGASIFIQGKQAMDTGDRLAGLNQGLLGWNFLGITLSVTIPFAAYLYVSRRSITRNGLLLVTMCSTMWMLVLNASRGGFIGVIISILLTIWYILLKSSRGRIVAFLIPVFLAIGLARAPDLLWVRLQTIWSDSNSSADSVAGSADQSTDSRITQLRNSIQYTLENPVVGLGIGNFPVYNGERVHRPDAWLGTHNTFTQLSSETGFPGLVLFLFLLGTIVSHAISILRDSAREDMHFLARATIISVVAFAIGGFFAHIAYEYLFYYVAAISAAMWTISRGSGISPEPEVNVRRVGREVRAKGMQTL